MFQVRLALTFAFVQATCLPEETCPIVLFLTNMMAFRSRNVVVEKFGSVISFKYIVRDLRVIDHKKIQNLPTDG